MTTANCYAVIFSTLRFAKDGDGYPAMSARMLELAQKQKGFIRIESVRDASTGRGVSVSYWETLEDIKNWKQNLEHLHAQKMGKEKWYDSYSVSICKVVREYSA